MLGWDADGVRVGTADGVILLTSVSDADDAPGPAAAWAERNGLRPGDRFEPVSTRKPPRGRSASGPSRPKTWRGNAVERTRIVVIGAHPDDELLGAGGTLARHVLAGDEVHAIVVADGAGSRYPAELVATLEKQARRAAEVIGFTSLQFLSLPDQRLDTVPLIELTQRLEGVLDEIGPDTVYTHFPEDVNADHGLVARCAWTACRPYGRPQVRKFAVFETPSSTEWAWPMTGTRVPAQLVRRRDGHAGDQDRGHGMLRDRAQGLSAPALEPGAQGTSRLLGKPRRPARRRAVRRPQRGDMTRRAVLMAISVGRHRARHGMHRYRAGHREPLPRAADHHRL